ncbi:hypothetical protein [Nocardioides litoris]|uniref:hypothetical protein n=1 Tax=Nocardioides litoris TaxID=1926648 RepID=UPI00111FC9C7|nr:hypothetical protein [Nocardioides litoris]
MALDDPAPVSRTAIAVVAVVGLLVLGWGVVGLWTSPAVDRVTGAAPDERVEATCAAVMASPGDGGVVETRRDGEVVDPDLDVEGDGDPRISRDVFGSTVAASCDQARGRRTAVALQAGLAGGAVLVVAGSLARRRREYLA